VKGAFLYNHFRQEFLKLNRVPLSSDCYSKFGKHDHKYHRHEIKEAAKRLETEVIPQFAKDLIEGVQDEADSFEIQLEELPQLIADMHLRGINVRYLMILFQCLSASPYLRYVSRSFQ
jgi:hypothetical protein